MALTKEERKLLRQKNAADVKACWRRFKRNYPTKMSCLQEIYRVLGEGILRCRSCDEKLSLTDERWVICPGCNKRHWYTATTLLERVRRPDAWLAVFFFFEDGTAVSAKKLADLVGCSVDTTRTCRLKLAYCLEQGLNKDDTFASAELLYSYCKHSLETPPRLHPRSEEEALQQAESERLGLLTGEGESASPGTRRSEPADNQFSTVDVELAPVDHSLVDAHLLSGGKVATGSMETMEHEGIVLDDSPEGLVLGCFSSTPISIEVLQQQSGLDMGPLNAALLMLELSGLIKPVGGARYVRVERGPPPPPRLQQPPVSKRLARVIECFRDFVSVYWHGVSRKYVQLYLSCYWYTVARKELATDYLIDICTRFGYINFDSLLSYVSPLTLALDKIDPPPLTKALIGAAEA